MKMKQTMIKNLFTGLFLFLVLSFSVCADMLPDNPSKEWIGNHNHELKVKIAVFYFIAFFTTFVVEFGILFLFLRKSFPVDKILALSFVINVLTNPLANFVLSLVGSYWLRYFFVIEVCVWLIESFLIYWLLKKKLSFRKVVLCSFVANLVTAILSFVPAILIIGYLF